MHPESPTPLPRSRAEARAIDSPFYQGRPCCYGHSGPRYTSSKSCVCCMRQAQRTWRLKNKASCAERQRQWRQKNRAHHQAYARAYNDRNAERINRLARERYARDPQPKQLAAKRYRERHPHRIKEARVRMAEQRRQRWQAYYLEHREALLERARRRAKTNRDTARIREHRRRVRKMSAKGQFTSKDIQALFASQRGLCVYCQADLRLGQHIDHIIPLSRGGLNHPSNLQLLCPTCNIRKSNLLPEEFKRRRKEHSPWT